MGQNQGVRWLLCQRWQAVWDDSSVTLLQLQLKDKMHVKTKKERQREEGSAKLAVVHFRGRHGNHSGRATKKSRLWALIQKSFTNLFIIQSITFIQSIYSILLSLLIHQYSSEKEFSVFWFAASVFPALAVQPVIPRELRQLSRPHCMLFRRGSSPLIQWTVLQEIDWFTLCCLHC